MESLASNPDFTDFNLIVSMDGRNREVINQIEQVRSPDHLITFEPDTNEHVASRISRNVRLGIEFVFEIVGSPWVLVLEDDLVVSEDVLRWHTNIQFKYQSDKLFVAANSFSTEIPQTPQAPAWSAAHVRLNYGVGWGWSISSNSYKRIAWSFPKGTNQIWDAQIEPAVRAGFVVNPLFSRVANTGLGQEATHTTQPADSQLESGMHGSMAGSSWNVTGSNEVCADFKWRYDCICLSTLTPFRTLAVIGIGQLRAILERASRAMPDGIKDRFRRLGKMLFKLQIATGGMRR